MVSNNLKLCFLLILISIIPNKTNAQIYVPDPRFGFVSSQLDSNSVLKIQKQTTNPNINLNSKSIEQGQDLVLEFLTDVNSQANIDILTGSKAQCIRRQAIQSQITAGSIIHIETSSLKKGVYLLMVNRRPEWMLRFEVY